MIPRISPWGIVRDTSFKAQMVPWPGAGEDRGRKVLFCLSLRKGAQTIGVPQRPDLYGLGREPPHHTLGQGHKLEQHQERRCQYQAPEGSAGQGTKGVPGKKGGQAHPRQENSAQDGEGKAESHIGSGMHRPVSQGRPKQDAATDGQD